jgi:predicted nucleic acid-binding protein
MTVAPLFVFDASPLVASCQFAVGGQSVAAHVLTGTPVQIPPAVYTEVVIRGGTRPDALEAARLVREGQLHLVDATHVGTLLDDLQYYQLGLGEQEAITLAVRLSDAVFVTDDFLALIVAHRLGVMAQLFLDFVVGRTRSGALPVPEAQQIVQAVSPRYPRGFVPHSLALLRSLVP